MSRPIYDRHGNRLWDLMDPDPEFYLLLYGIKPLERKHVMALHTHGKRGGKKSGTKGGKKGGKKR